MVRSLGRRGQTRVETCRMRGSLWNRWELVGQDGSAGERRWGFGACLEEGPASKDLLSYGRLGYCALSNPERFQATGLASPVAEIVG